MQQKQIRHKETIGRLGGLRPPHDLMKQEKEKK
jgi:hypothetical protein